MPPTQLPIVLLESGRLKPLKVRHNQETLNWVNERHKGNESTKRRDAKRYYSWIASAMLKPDWGFLDGNISYERAQMLLRAHPDFPKYGSNAAQRQWLSRRINLICSMPNVVKMPRFIMLITLITDHGGDQAIEAHHAAAAAQNRRNKAAWQQKERNRLSQREPANAIYALSQPNRLIVESQATKPLTPSPPPVHKSLAPDPTTTEDQAISIVAARPMPSASANRATPSKAAAAKLPRPGYSRRSSMASQAIPGFGPSPQLIPSAEDQMLADPVSFRSRSDNAEQRRAALLSVPDWLGTHVPPAKPKAGNFDPRTNPAARRVANDGPLTMSQLEWIRRQDVRLSGLKLAEVEAIGATDDLLYCAYESFSMKTEHIRHPHAFFKYLVKKYHDGAYRYAWGQRGSRL